MDVQATAFRSPSPQLQAAVDRYLDGDERAFDHVYRALAPRVRALLCRLGGDPVLADDLTQETFASMVVARGAFRRGADVTPWAQAIARNLFRDHLRRARLRRVAAGEVPARGDDLASPAPDEELVARRMASSVADVIATLPAGQMEAFRMVREEGRSLDEAAAALGRTELSVRLSVHRARTAVRAHLADRWGVRA